MNFARWLPRWLPTFLAFPLGGWLAVQTAGSIDGPAKAALAGVLAGGVVGFAQWLALRPRGVPASWAVYTAGAMGGGSALAAVLTDARTDVQSLMLGALVTGALVGGAQAVALRRGPVVGAAWAGTVSLAWALGWLPTWGIGVDVERGYVVFGASGALLTTALTGLVLWRLMSGKWGERSTVLAGGGRHEVAA
jgi:hypothetical protein